MLKKNQILPFFFLALKCLLHLMLFTYSALSEIKIAILVFS